MTTDSDSIGWAVSAIVKPGNQVDDAKSEPDPLDVEPQGWHAAAEGVRTTLKWTVTALAAVAAALFAKGFITTPQLSWTDNRAQLVWALVLGSIAILSVAVLIALVVLQMRPALFDLGHLPDGLNELIAKEPRAFLPSDCADLNEYRNNFNSLLSQADFGKQEVERRRESYEAAKAAERPDASLIRQTSDDFKLATEGYRRTIRNLTVYKSVRASLFDRAEYFRQSTAFNEHLVFLIIAAVLAAICGVGYQLALAAPKEPSGGNKPAPPVVGVLIAGSNDAGRQLWSDLRLKGLIPNQGVGGA